MVCKHTICIKRKGIKIEDLCEFNFYINSVLAHYLYKKKGNEK